VPRPRRLLEPRELRREAVVGELRLDEEPRPAVANDDEVHLSPVLVAEVAQLEAPESGVLPRLDGLLQVAGDERLGAGARVLDGDPS
jgi:hypothetical protein